MAGYTLTDLESLGTPEIIQRPDFESIFAGRKADFISRAPTFGLQPDVMDLETDPGVALLQESAFKETLLLARLNDVARSRYLYFARGAEVDHLAAFYDVVRAVGESDDRLKTRIILAIQGRSTGGTEARYASIAMGASIRVADVRVYTVGNSPAINIAVFAADNNGVADATLLESVRTAVNAPDARMINDTINVRSAVVTVQNVVANVKLFPNTPESLLATIAAGLPAAWIAESGLGRDLTHDWLKSKIVVPGVYGAQITAPVGTVVMNPFEAVRIGTVTLNFDGRAF